LTFFEALLMTRVTQLEKEVASLREKPAINITIVHGTPVGPSELLCLLDKHTYGPRPAERR
jgi:hypothetical protein